MDMLMQDDFDAIILDLTLPLDDGISILKQMRRFGYPLAPALVGAIPGPLAEEQLRRGLMINRGEGSFLVTSKIALLIYAIAILAVFGPRIWALLRNRGKGQVSRA
ncbi:MAG TPA: hypothetical protein VLA45_14070 [Paracoccaceae bacterium]|nr:hypothetical protein [Paracoccaceae bacterium]